MQSVVIKIHLFIATGAICLQYSHVTVLVKQIFIVYWNIGYNVHESVIV